MMDDAVDGKGAFEDGWATSGGVPAIVDGDTGPPAFTGGAYTIGAPDTPSFILEQGGLGKVVINDLSAKDI